MKQIKLTESDINTLTEDFKTKLINTRFTTDKVSYTKTLKIQSNTPIEKQYIFMTTETYLKMFEYVLLSDGEIGWQGCVRKQNNIYMIDNVFLYPQTVAAATVNTDQVTHTKWIESLSDDVLNSMRFQGHSHVNFGVTPSGVDLDLYENFLTTLPENDFYIFLIINKKQEMTFLIYDLEKNAIYDNEDIILNIGNTTEQNLLSNVSEEIKNKITKYTYVPLATQKYTQYQMPSALILKQTKAEKKSLKKQKEYAMLEEEYRNSEIYAYNKELDTIRHNTYEEDYPY